MFPALRSPPDLCFLPGAPHLLYCSAFCSVSYKLLPCLICRVPHAQVARPSPPRGPGSPGGAASGTDGPWVRRCWARRRHRARGCACHGAGRGSTGGAEKHPTIWGHLVWDASSPVPCTTPHKAPRPFATSGNRVRLSSLGTHSRRQGKRVCRENRGVLAWDSYSRPVQKKSTSLLKK